MSNGIPHDDWALTHHGVKGMRWGVRKVRQSIGRAAGRVRSSIKTRRTAAKTKKAAAKKRATEDSGAAKLSEYSTAELRSVVERLELENRYMRATNERANMQKGSSKVDSALKSLNTLGNTIESVNKIASGASKLAKTIRGQSSDDKKTVKVKKK